jgi:hypothetical protein
VKKAIGFVKPPSLNGLPNPAPEPAVIPPPQLPPQKYDPKPGTIKIK